MCDALSAARLGTAPTGNGPTAFPIMDTDFSRSGTYPVRTMGEYSFPVSLPSLRGHADNKEV